MATYSYFLLWAYNLIRVMTFDPSLIRNGDVTLFLGIICLMYSQYILAK